MYHTPSQVQIPCCGCIACTVSQSRIISGMWYVPHVVPVGNDGINRNLPPVATGEAIGCYELGMTLVPKPFHKYAKIFGSSSGNE